MFVSDDDSGEKSVSVLLAGEESELVFLDQSCSNVGPVSVGSLLRSEDLRRLLTSCRHFQDAEIDGAEPHAYCVVYSTSDKGSLRTAEGWLKVLRNKKPSRARILVGNKADLVRSRTVAADGGFFSSLSL